MKNREIRGIIVFSLLSLLVLLIGGIMTLFDQHAVGTAGPRHGKKGTVVLSGKDVMIVGAILLLLALLCYWMVKRDGRK